jgi:hypothetical protein
MKWSLSAWLWLLVTAAPAALVVQVAPPKSTGSKAIVKLELQNTYNEKIKSVRAVMFLVDDQGKVVGQTASWIIGGRKDKPALAPSAKAIYDFLVPADKPFTSSRLIISRIIMEDGTLGNVQKDVQIQAAPQ